jgi:hypothetical protein
VNEVVGRIEQLTETAKLGVSIGGPAGAALVMADKYDKRIAELEAKLRRCREIMECNDPINARDIFGPPAQGKAHE